MNKSNKEKEYVPPYMFTKYYYEKLDEQIVNQLSTEGIHKLINDLQKELEKRGEIEINYRIYNTIDQESFKLLKKSEKKKI